ncbi:MAG: DUF4259 domain-containing protein [Candidatus Magasanikbacteria bacterium]
MAKRIKKGDILKVSLDKGLHVYVQYCGYTQDDFEAEILAVYNCITDKDINIDELKNREIITYRVLMGSIFNAARHCDWFLVGNLELPDPFNPLFLTGQWEVLGYHKKKPLSPYRVLDIYGNKRIIDDLPIIYPLLSFDLYQSPYSFQESLLVLDEFYEALSKKGINVEQYKKEQKEKWTERTRKWNEKVAAENRKIHPVLMDEDIQHDFVNDIDESPSLGIIKETINAVLEEDEYLDSEVSTNIIVVSILLECLDREVEMQEGVGFKKETIEKLVKEDWKQYVEPTKKALKKIMKQSELKELNEENGMGKKWVKRIKELHDMLNRI